MTQREQMQALLAGERPDVTPQWCMGVPMPLARAIAAPDGLYKAYGEYPDEGAYPFVSMGEAQLLRAKKFNEAIDRCAFPVGWGAFGGFGHGGPGEFNKTVIEKNDARFIVRYETGAKKEVRLHPHNVHTFYLPVNTMEDLEALELPDPNDPARYEGFRQDTAWAKGQGLWTIGFVNGFFSGVHYFMRDYPEFLMDLLCDEEFAVAVIRRTGEWTLAAAGRMCEAGVDCIGLCDDLGSERSLLFSPDLYRKLFAPWHRRLCELAHGYGVAVHLHSHGCILPILADVAACGFDILNPLDPNENMDFGRARELAGKKLVFCGGMNKFFFDWTPAEQEENLRGVIAAGRKYGPHILMDSGGLPDNVTLDGFKTFLEISARVRSEKA